MSLNIKTKNHDIGNKGEGIACIYLEKLGYFIQERNYLRKWGEIDIIAVKDSILHFIEVKSVVDRGNRMGYRPEENVHQLKQIKLRRVIQTYLNEHKYSHDTLFKFHIITVVIKKIVGESVVEMFEDIIL